MSDWSYVAIPKAKRDLKRLDKQVRRRILEALDRLVQNYPHGNVKKLQGTDEDFRLRVGDWRVIFTKDEDKHLIVVSRVLPRDRAYR